MKVIKISPRGYCHGVISALNLVSKSIGNSEIPKPIYILGEIVHNQNITKAFNEAGATTLTGENRAAILEQVDEGTIIITAHGIDPHLITLAQEKGLTIIDGTCSDVYSTHNLIKEKLNNDYEIIYIGKQGHPEPEGVIGIDKERIHLVSNIDDIKLLPNFSKKIFVTNQTTMSVWDIQALITFIKEKYPEAEIADEICLATQQRQEAAFLMAKKADLTLVVGDPKSNNTNKLVEVSKRASKREAYRINSVEDIDIKWLLDPTVIEVAITSGASTPTILTKEVITFVENFDKNDQKTWDNTSKIDNLSLIPRIKKN